MDIMNDVTFTKNRLLEIQARVNRLTNSLSKTEGQNKLIEIVRLQGQLINNIQTRINDANELLRNIQTETNNSISLCHEIKSQILSMNCDIKEVTYESLNKVP